MLRRILEEVEEKENDFDFLEPTQEMINYFVQRTNKHIFLVRKSMEKLIKNIEGLNKHRLRRRARLHDKSKFSDDEALPYIWLSWYRRDGAKDDIPENIQPFVDEGWLHHYENNDHHVEYYDNIEDMSDDALREMCCDQNAMAVEMGSDLRTWNEKFVKEHKFNDEQKKIIDECVDALEN